MYPDGFSNIEPVTFFPNEYFIVPNSKNLYLYDGINVFLNNGNIGDNAYNEYGYITYINWFDENPISSYTYRRR